MGEVNNNTNDEIQVNSKVEEHPCGVESNSYSETMENESEKLSADEKVAASGLGYKQDIHKVTDDEVKGNLCETNDDNITQITADLFHESDGDELSTSDNIGTNRSDIKTCSDRRRKPENGD